MPAAGAPWWIGSETRIPFARSGPLASRTHPVAVSMMGAAKERTGMRTAYSAAVSVPNRQSELSHPLATSSIGASLRWASSSGSERKLS